MYNNKNAYNKFISNYFTVFTEQTHRTHFTEHCIQRPLKSSF